jgi:PD-(D/E)XK nuclease superfamily
MTSRLETLASTEKHQKGTIMEPLLYEEETYQIRGEIFEVYEEMGCGFLEPVYQECLK